MFKRSLRRKMPLVAFGFAASIFIYSAAPGVAQNIPLPQKDVLSYEGPDLLIVNSGHSPKKQAIAIEGRASGVNVVGVYGDDSSGQGPGIGVYGTASGTNGFAVYGLVTGGSGNIPGQFILNDPNAQFGQSAIIAQHQGGAKQAGLNGRYGNAGNFQITNPLNFDSVIIATTHSDEGTGIEGDDLSNGGGVAILGVSNAGVSAQFTGGSGGAGTCEYDGSSGFNCPSDRNLKTAFVPVNETRLLNQLAAMPVFEYSMRGARQKARYVGPTSQDFRAAFHLGTSDKTINTANAQGVALAAAKALYARVKQDEAKIASLEKQLIQQKAAMGDLMTLKRSVAHLQAVVIGLPAAKPLQQASVRRL